MSDPSPSSNSRSVLAERLLELVYTMPPRSMPEVRQFHKNEIERIVDALDDAGRCPHRIADIRNSVIKSGYMCVDCGRLFRAADHDVGVPQVPQPCST